MVSAGTAEISKLMNSATQNVSVPVAENEAGTNKKFVESSYKDPSFTRVAAKSKENMKAFSPALTDKGECASSVLMDNQQPEVLEMHQLEAELESELQILPRSAMEESSSEGRTDIFDAEVLAEGELSEEFENASSYQYGRVLAGELCHLLVEQQESQIMGLEAELHHAHSKLHQKEAELQKLKDCVKRLTEFSLANPSGTIDEEAEEDVKAITDGVEEEKLMSECTKSTVGMKRKH